MEMDRDPERGDFGEEVPGKTKENEPDAPRYCWVGENDWAKCLSGKGGHFEKKCEMLESRRFKDGEGA